MLQLRNDELRVDVLDPGADAARLGPRYCWGGYIWQVQDRSAGPLLSGPEWPASDPTPFNGQGLPESFRHRSLEGNPFTWNGDRGVAIGAGELRAEAGDKIRLTAPCHWQISAQPGHIEFTTEHAAAGFDYALHRRLQLAGRELRSTTRLTNRSASQPLVLEWFAHPFFALVDGRVRVQLPAGASLPENAGFTLDAEGVLASRRRFTAITDGHMDRGLRLPPGQPLRATFAHPALSHVTFETGFVPDAYVIWGNDRTFSIEPYLSLKLAPGASREWSLLYRFGASSGISASSVSSRPPEAR